MIDTLVSVIIPTFKREKEIVQRAVQSVLAQTYHNLEVIIVDDSPADYQGSNSIKEFLLSLNDNRILYIKHLNNRGANAARNTGIQRATGDYVAFLDDDDEWLPPKIESQIEKFNDSNIGMVYCPYFIIKNGEKKQHKTLLKSGDLFSELLRYNFIGSTSCVMIKRNCILDVGMFDVKLRASQDYDMYLRISEKYLINFVEEPLMHYHVHDGERITGDPNKKLEARKYIYSKYKEKIKKYPKIDSEKNLLLALGYSQINENSLKWKHWFKAILIYPIPSKSLIKNTFKIVFKRY